MCFVNRDAATEISQHYKEILVLLIQLWLGVEHTEKREMKSWLSLQLITLYSLSHSVWSVGLGKLCMGMFYYVLH